MISYDKILQWQRGTRPEQIAAELASQIEKGKFTK
jgi:hypothetical protein